MVCAQADTPILPESEGGPFLYLCRFRILCKCSISSSLQQLSREWAGKADNSLGCGLLLPGAVKLSALVYQLQGKKYLCGFFSVVQRIWFEQTLSLQT